MALVVQNDTGTADANAYVSLAAFKAYHDDRGNDYSAFIDAKLNGAIIRATDFIDTRYNFLGVKLTNGVKATGTLTTTGNFSNGEIVTIGGQTYMFKNSPSAANDVQIGIGVATSLTNLATALATNTDVTAIATSTTLVVTAAKGGVDGNSIATTETSGTASWSGTTLSGGKAQTTEFPRQAGSNNFTAFFDVDIQALLIDPSSTFIALVGPDGLDIIGIPPAIMRACHEYAFRALSEPLFQDAPAPEGGRLLDEHTVKVDVIEETIKYASPQSGGFAMPAFPQADLWITRAGLVFSGRQLVR